MTSAERLVAKTACKRPLTSDLDNVSAANHFLDAAKAINVTLSGQKCDQRVLIGRKSGQRVPLAGGNHGQHAP